MEPQSSKVKAVVDELVALRKQYDAQQAVLRKRLHDLFYCGPSSSQRQVVCDLVDMFLFPEVK